MMVSNSGKKGGWIVVEAGGGGVVSPRTQKLALRTVTPPASPVKTFILQCDWRGRIAGCCNQPVA